ncbi:EpsG family protein [Aquimarina celericrescens]|uniref:EpsG family protein n=1 Tax=Aquimarina celericrescens TaxID=1964542 RepID=A0ABW5AR65_9FLAO|nr:EpsG family protein [Aquimarina celericrescens]
MNTLVPLELYFPVYINLLLFLAVFTLLHTGILKMEDHRNVTFINISGYILIVFLILYLGQRPLSGRYFGDMRTYTRYFEWYQNGGEILGSKDIFFHMYMKGLSSVVSLHTFFTICAAIYILPLYRVSKKLFNQYWYYAFVMFVVSFSFYTYGVNGIRNGMATSLFLLAISNHKNKVIMGLCFLLSVSFHKTMFLPTIAFLITYLYNNPKTYLKGWLVCIPLSLVMGSVWIALFSSLGFADDRLSGYLTAEVKEGTFASTGFRWDFLFHSAFAVFAGWYFVYKKKYEDKLYFQLLNTYLISNGFWVLVIRANYSNRFAYLSWFMMGLVIIYPFLKERFFRNHHFMLGKVILVYFSFTYLMFYLYS